MSETRILEPTRITQGENVTWTRAFDDFPASEYTLVYCFRGPGAGVDITTTADGDGFTADLTAAISAKLKPGKWMWQAWATEIADASNVRMLTSGFTQVALGLKSSGLAAVELRSDAQIMVDMLDAALLQAGDVLEYEVSTPSGMKHVKRAMRSEIIAQRKYYAGIVANEAAKERVRQGGSFTKQIAVRFFDE